VNKLLELKTNLGYSLNTTVVVISSQKKATVLKLMQFVAKYVHFVTKTTVGKYIALFKAVYYFHVSYVFLSYYCYTFVSKFVIIISECLLVLVVNSS